LILLPILINVAFLTLLERKILSYSQIRKGPNKVSFIGFLQPIADVVKLFTKENNFLVRINYKIFFSSPLLNIFLIIFL
jgi:NADH-ubiquinone oxidoreductase chain 1